jgi:hypothetical protein
MKFQKEEKTLLIETKDFKKPSAFKGSTVSLIKIPIELKEQWEQSDLKMACLPMLEIGGKIEFT